MRFTFNELLPVRLEHLISDFHYEESTSIQIVDSLDTMKGYTEWLSRSQPRISIGWEWRLSYNSRKPQYAIVGYPFSNIQIIDKNAKDFEMKENLMLIKTFAVMLDWEETVDAHIREKYS